MLDFICSYILKKYIIKLKLITLIYTVLYQNPDFMKTKMTSEKQ